MEAKAISFELFKKRLEAVLSCGSFELKFENDDCLIPYMMSDAVESILILRSCRMTGHFDPDIKGPINAEFLEGENSGVIIRQEGNVFSLWYESLAEDTRLYRYDQIGHFWVQRLEQWRRLTYIIGTMHDKFHHLGREYCNETEEAICDLIEFGPFRLFTPVEFSLDYRYDESPAGAHIMAMFAEGADRPIFAKLCRLYGRFPNPWLRKRLAMYLTKSKNQLIFEILHRITMEAASQWPERDYGPEQNEYIEKMRSDAHERITAAGFTGEYPFYHFKDIQILAAEEHPFTQFESADFEFTIRYMVSRSPNSGTCAGFFFGKGNESFIAENLDELLRQGEENGENN